MNDYFLRCEAADVPALCALGVLLGALRHDPDTDTFHGVAPHAFHIIGPVFKATGAVVETGDGPVPAVAPVLGGDGLPLWHANLRYGGDLMATARAIESAGAAPELAAGLADLGRYFVTDPATWRAVRPGAPVAVFA